MKHKLPELSHEELVLQFARIVQRCHAQPEGSVHIVAVTAFLELVSLRDNFYGGHTAATVRENDDGTVEITVKLEGKRAASYRKIRKTVQECFGQVVHERWRKRSDAAKLGHRRRGDK